MMGRAVAASVVIFGWLWSIPAQSQIQETPTAPDEREIGRYQIIFSRNEMRFAFLLDTSTGKVWKLTQYPDLMGSPFVWEIMPRLETDAEFSEFINANRPPPVPPQPGKPPRR